MKKTILAVLVAGLFTPAFAEIGVNLYPNGLTQSVSDGLYVLKAGTNTLTGSNTLTGPLTVASSVTVTGAGEFRGATVFKGDATVNANNKLHFPRGADQSPTAYIYNSVTGSSGSNLQITGDGSSAGVITMTPGSAGAVNIVGAATVSTNLGVTGNATVTGSAFSVGGSTLVVSGGKVGVGTGSPFTDLTVVYSTAVTSGWINRGLTINNSAGTAGDTAGILFGTSLVSNPKQYIGGVRTAAGSGVGDLIFALSSTADTNPVLFSDEKMRILANGNVGIGTTAPSTKLHVSSGVVTIDGTGGDIYTSAWTAYGATSTVVGWSSFTTKEIFTKKVGKTVLVAFRLVGTSNAVGASFTVPEVATSTPTRTATFGISAVDNGGTMVNGRAAVNASDNIIYLAPTPSASTTGWTGSGTKEVEGQFFYEAAN